MTTHTRFIRHWIIALTTLTATWAGANAAAPDIVLIVADNLGHGDLGCYGCRDIQTPHIAAIAAAGVRFPKFYSNGPECSHTRTAL